MRETCVDLQSQDNYTLFRETPISPAPPTDSEYLRSGMRYMIHNEELKSMFEKQAGVEWFDLIQTFHACKQDEGKPVGPYHNMGKTVGELHVMLIEYEKGLPKKAETPQVMMIKGGKIQKSNKKSLKAKGKGKANGKGKDKQVYIPKPKNPKPSAKEHPAKDDTCHHYKEVGHYSTYLWHYRLTHISKKRIEKLQQEGILKSTDDESFDQCISCLSGKMTRKSFPRRPERATDLVGIIHTNVCGLLKNVSRQAYSPYTPQHNGVSERRNRTLLDMVRSMMNLTTLPLSFRDYALESATRILNMVPTKKVDKTPYELWYGKVPNLSYLKVWDMRRL
ncbi:retrotransposon protein, putative, ty1-copia subclass [Tanacetum coccineum]